MCFVTMMVSADLVMVVFSDFVALIINVVGAKPGACGEQLLCIQERLE